MCQQRALIVLFFPTHLARPNIGMGKRVQHFGIKFVITTIKLSYNMCKKVYKIFRNKVIHHPTQHVSKFVGNYKVIQGLCES